MKKVILVNASPRKNGNCAVIVQKLAEELKNEAVEIFDLNQKTVKPCLACGACKTKETAMCVQKDDMRELIDKLDACDAFVLLTPIYFGQINGPAKTWIDRLYCFFNPAKPMASMATKRGKKAALICPCGAGPVETYQKYAQETAGSFGIVGADETKVLICGDANAPGSWIKDAAHAAEVCSLAKWIAE